jgi:hypothetical protein
MVTRRKPLRAKRIDTPFLMKCLCNPSRPGDLKMWAELLQKRGNFVLLPPLKKNRIIGFRRFH